MRSLPGCKTAFSGSLKRSGEILFAGQPFQPPESYLRNAELYEEGQTGNYNMLGWQTEQRAPGKNRI